jgi:hypothetical protein
VAYRLYSAGFADSVSVSFIPRECSPAYDRGTGAMDISSAELLEVSAAGVPSEVNAKDCWPARFARRCVVDQQPETG